jgi:hypothetical protein
MTVIIPALARKPVPAILCGRAMLYKFYVTRNCRAFFDFCDTTKEAESCAAAFNKHRTSSRDSALIAYDGKGRFIPGQEDEIFLKKFGIHL